MNLWKMNNSKQNKQNKNLTKPTEEREKYVAYFSRPSGLPPWTVNFIHYTAR